MNALRLIDDCWNRIGIHGDRSCPELKRVLHCHNCPIYVSAGQVLLDRPPPQGYLAAERERLAAPPADQASDTISVLVFRLGDEWLALGVDSLLEVTTPRRPHRVPGRVGLLQGIVNIRGELQLCVNLRKLVTRDSATNDESSKLTRCVVMQRDADRWVFHADEVDQVVKLPLDQLRPIPATIRRSSAHLSRGFFELEERAIGYLDDARLFQTLKARLHE